ncbi:cupin domain-containing protein [Oleiagrimonas soli]|uniref:Putative cupin superfamily protein n=1 Tax=Oleiagrimonas soli TaxID=1543381 RepID=A0A099CX75_9GAMM|nr:cupin domain-containing protein [Oleiagrimonas soli]KGI78354.1 transcriptional regulator [Oleiagrimonas soli]MBB6183144.1 putative cupin superfamily protein [Oleiagrimonas soli]
MPKLDLDRIPARRGSSYPPPHDAICTERLRQRLGEAGGLTDFGVNLLQLPPGVSSSQRHWHSDEDEFVWVLQGEVVLRTEAGETVLRAGDCAAFPKGKADGHQLSNRSPNMAVCLEVGSRSTRDVCTYSDIDMVIDAADDVYRHRDGTPWPR